MGSRWHVDETYVRISGVWHYLYRAIDRDGQVVDVLLSSRRDSAAARSFFLKARIVTDGRPGEVVTDRAPAYPAVIAEMCPGAIHVFSKAANNPVECDHGRLKARLRTMRGLKRGATTAVIVAGHAFVQNVRRGFYSADHPEGVSGTTRLKQVFATLLTAA